MTARQRSRPGTVLASALALPLLAIASPSLADVVNLTSDATTKGAAGGVIRGTVISESASKVEVKLGNTVTTIPTNEVVSITYDGHPASLEQAQAKESANSLLEAADLYKKAASEASGKTLIVEDALFGQAHALADYALTDANRSSEAIALLENFGRTYKNGRHASAALETLAKLQLAREDYKGVESTLTALSNLPRGDDRSAILRIKVLTRKGQAEQAITELDKLIAAAPDGSIKKRDAQLTKA